MGKQIIHIWKKILIPKRPIKYVIYLDASNLYGWAMCKPLPIGGFEWMSDSELEDWKNYPCVL